MGRRSTKIFNGCGLAAGAAVLILFFGAAGTCMASQSTAAEDEALGIMLAKQVVRANTHWTTTDHSKVGGIESEFHIRGADYKGLPVLPYRCIHAV